MYRVPAAGKSLPLTTREEMTWSDR